MRELEISGLDWWKRLKRLDNNDKEDMAMRNHAENFARNLEGTLKVRSWGYMVGWDGVSEGRGRLCGCFNILN